MIEGMKVRFIPLATGELEGLFLSYGIDVDEVYDVVGYGDKVLVKVGNRLVDVYPSRLEVME